MIKLFVPTTVIIVVQISFFVRCYSRQKNIPCRACRARLSSQGARGTPYAGAGRTKLIWITISQSTPGGLDKVKSECLIGIFAFLINMYAQQER